MKTPQRSFNLFMVVALGLLLFQSAGAIAQTQMSKVKHVFIIMMENHNWTGDNSGASFGDPDLKGNSEAPYINSLIPLYAHAENYYNPPGNHPSNPNYLWLEAGTNFGDPNDDTPQQKNITTTQHLVTFLANASPTITWKAYAEPEIGSSDFSDCEVNGNAIDENHVAMLYFSDTTDNFSSTSPTCIAHIVPYDQLQGDLNSGVSCTTQGQTNCVAQYTFIAPNTCDQGHEGVSGCPGQPDDTMSGDTWLKNNVPLILNSSIYKQDGALFIVWDEAEDGSCSPDGSDCGDGPIGMFVLSPFAQANGYTSTSSNPKYTHSSLLKTLQEIFGVTPLLGDAANSATLDLSEFFLPSTGPSASLSPASLSFSNQTVGTTSASQSVTLTNNGPGTLTIGSVAITGTNAGDFAQTNGCGTSLNANATCNISVTFTPTATGARSATLSVTDGASNSPQTTPLNGTGVAANPTASLNLSSLTFGNQTVSTTSNSQSVTLTNNGPGLLSGISIAINGTNAGDFAQTNGCGTSLNANTTCNISVTFTPAAAGARSATLSVTDNASNSPQTASLSGTGVVAPDFSLSASPSSQSVTAGGNTSYTTNVSPLNGFTGDVSLSVTGQPAGATPSFNPASISGGSGSSTLTVSTIGSTAAGGYTLTITGTSGSLSHTTTVTLTVTVVAVSIAPNSASLQVGMTQQFTTRVTGTSNTAVTWQVNGVAGGNSTVGTISTSGLYTAPALVPNPATVTVTAVSQADTTKSASAAVTVTTSTFSFSQIKNVWVIMMEDHNWTGDTASLNIKGNPSAPYINNTLLPMGAHAENYNDVVSGGTALNHSLPNYLWLEAGQTFSGFGDNSVLPSVSDIPCYGNDSSGSGTCPPADQHLAYLLDHASPAVSWKVYAEADPGPVGQDCPLDGTELYNPHVPFSYFADDTGDSTESDPFCTAHIQPFSQLATDLSGGTAPQYSFIVPSQCDDMDNSCSPTNNNIVQGDTWLQNNLPTILNSTAYKNGGAVFIIWDEAHSGDGPIGMIVLSPFAKAGYSNTIHYDHSSTLKTLQEIFGVTPLLGGASTATDLSDLF